MRIRYLKWIVQCSLCAVLATVSHKVGSYGGSMGQILYQMLYTHMAVVTISVVLGDIGLYRRQQFSMLAVVAGVFGGVVGFSVALFLGEGLGRFVPYLPAVFLAIPIIVPVMFYNGVASWRRKSLSEKEKAAAGTVTNCIWMAGVVCVALLGWCYVARPSVFDWITREKAAGLEEATRRFSTAGSAAEMKRLLKEGADVNAKGLGGRPALHNAAMFGDIKTVKMLINHGVNVNAKDAYGNTALNSIWFRANPEVVELLLSAGADPNIKNNKGISAVDTAEEILVSSGGKFPERMEKCARILVEHAGKK